ncbi:hypothetical protein [Alteraurantiacibacter buctensis]|uniref:hypothetical protein n=1 Tax=Alteraurantiacibacter buctensis TaxID=1503981 RepID=UPI001F1E9F43|nr:hypothetical protein [Alteraurantiacibacter buctensis]
MSDKTAGVVAQSLSLLKDHRQGISSAMKRYVGRSDSADGVPMIFDMLFDYAPSLSGYANNLPDPGEIQRRHMALGITSQTYSLFGDGLGAILRDVLGAQATPALISAWGDTYWAIVRLITQSSPQQ